MSVSLYYEAKRSQPITRQELDACMEIAKRYDRQYPYGELYEGFCIYDPEECSEQSDSYIIFSGATKLPPMNDDNDINSVFRVANWWLKCLGEITDLLSGAQWHVHIDGGEIEWSKEERQLFPIEE
ncbi:MAG: hypothetical protein HFH05_08330 [Lachnospiraceae bacterium]|nr:hypothetical protein [Lachnospiraceae bacterium]MCI9675420.1 hypothetical protein [Lachnospiraceae bacterium]